ncbi:hypothetical protein LCGC14_2578820 [marine sediment metagenome]|uniref:Uncharacterized protein n=1 Tax=marine sediment metagenome TaxID=412755 RepID=A0A0F9AFE0_9ZZZZ
MSILSTLATQFTQNKITEMANVRKKTVARKAERARVDKIHSSRVVTKKKSVPPTRSQKASSRRDSIMKKVTPHRNLLKALTIKKK